MVCLDWTQYFLVVCELWVIFGQNTFGLRMLLSNICQFLSRLESKSTAWNRHSWRGVKQDVMFDVLPAMARLLEG